MFFALWNVSRPLALNSVLDSTNGIVVNIGNATNKRRPRGSPFMSSMYRALSVGR